MANIVGPPGTGKSFAGAELALATLAATDQKILVVCFTNHALDQFLCHLLDKNERRIVRIGGKSREERLDRFSLFNLKRDARLDRDKAERTHLYDLYTELEDVRRTLNDAFARLQARTLTWPQVSALLAIEDPRALQQLQVPARRDRDGFQIVDKYGQQIKDDYLWDLWIRGKDGRPFNSLREAPLWLLPSPKRQALLAQWVELAMEEVKDELRSARHRFDQLDAELSAMDTASERVVLQGARVIGATTTGSAKYRALIESAAPGVLLLEEAGEVLEAHVISSMGANIKHVIMIGDHKQLRPKVETHALTVAAKNGYDLNRSLFERLIVNGLAHTTLETQHRMRPEISSIARYMTYPELRDSDDVLDRADVRGLAANVVFINHAELEQGEADDGLAFKSLSKVNEFEADLAVQIVQFFLMQGYRSDDMVVLTPYLGQLKVLNDKFRRHRITATVGERDVDELLNIGVEQPWLQQISQSARGIRTCTIDNYQGEEADLIITTLVRSNTKGQLGFLGKADAEQRVNVLCTRARLGMVFIGNVECFRNAKPRSQLWTRLIGLLRERGAIFEGLPIKCQRHGALCAPCDVSRPEQLRQWCASGAGCGRQCDALLACGHVCPLKCHPWGHETVVCEQPVREDCPAGLHRIERACGSKATPFCDYKVITQCKEGHPLVRLCGDVKTPDCKVCKVLKEAKAAHGEESASRAREHAKLLQGVMERADQLGGDEGATEALRAQAQAELAECTERLAAKQAAAERKLAERLDAATLGAQDAVRRAMDELEQRKRLDEERLRARREEHARLLQDATTRMNEQRAATQAAAEAQIVQRDEAMRTLHEALAANLAADEDAIAQVNADRADPEEVARQLQQVRLSAKPVTCEVCMDDLTILDGPLCKPVDGHFVCRECFDAHVIEEAAKPAFDGEIYCPCRPAVAGGCTSAAYPGAVIARHATDAAFEAVNHSRAALRERENNEKMQREFDARVDAEKAKFEEMLRAMAATQAAEQLKLLDAKKHIVEKILTLSCPRCGQAFIDFNGCCALACSRQGCDCGFCAYCLTDCGVDAHAHVANCPEGSSFGGVFCSQPTFEQAQKGRRRLMVLKYLESSGFDAGAQRRLLDMCKREFDDLGLVIAPPRAG